VAQAVINREDRYFKKAPYKKIPGEVNSNKVRDILRIYMAILVNALIPDRIQIHLNLRKRGEVVKRCCNQANQSPKAETHASPFSYSQAHFYYAEAF